MKNQVYNFLKRIQHKYFIKYDAPNQEDLDFFSKLIKPGDLIFDVGANKGDMAELFITLGEKVIAVEPQKMFAEILGKRFKNRTDIIVVNKALSSSIGESEILICDSAPTISTMSSDWASKGRFSSDFDWNRKEVIQTTTLDSLISEHGCPKFCKIDVEGFELEVISGLSQKIPFISIEYVNEFFDRSIACVEHLKKIAPLKLSTRNLALNLNIDEFHEPDFLLEKLQSQPGVVNGDIYIKFD